MPTHTNKRKTSYRLSDEARSILTRLAEKHGVSETAVIEMAMRRLARVDLAEGRWPAAAILDAAAALLEGKSPR